MTTAGVIDTLFKLLLAEPASDSGHALRTALAGARPEQFERAVEALTPHKVLPLLSHRARALGLLELIPGPTRERLMRVESEVRGLNSMLFLAAASILRAAEQRGEALLVLKGLLFADSYYPDFATRPMGDLDLVAAPGRAHLLHEALHQVGFSRVPDHVEQDHAVAFANAQGVACDAHSYLEMFPDADWEVLTRTTLLQRLRGVRVRALEPHVMLAHLMLHMHGHSGDLGFVLLWLLDVVFVMRRHRSELELARVRSLIHEPGAWALWLRLLGMLAHHGEPLPDSFRAAAHGLPALSLGQVLRARRITPWGLPAPLGWARLAAHHLSLRDYSHRTAPRLLDLCLMPTDLISARVAAHLGRLQRR
jgi:hypothetical protein